MNNLEQNYKIILDKLTENCSHIESFSQVRQPKLSNLEVVALNITAEYMSYNCANLQNQSCKTLKYLCHIRNSTLFRILRRTKKVLLPACSVPPIPEIASLF